MSLYEQKAMWWMRSATLLFASFWLLYVGFSNEVPADPGDGIMHFFYAQASWSDPLLFLHHWGKPVFILLSSGFAQFGFSGMLVFNVLVFSLMVCIGYIIFDHYECNRWLQSTFPILLLTANDIPVTITGGLTEPLFNLALFLAFYLFIKEKYAFFALLVSWMPFLRSEGQLVVLIALALLLWKREFSKTALLFSGFLCYALLGVFASKSFWWYFTESPYQMSNGIYGKGTWDHYLLSYKAYLGNPGLVVFILGTVSSFVLVIRNKFRELVLPEFLLAFGVFFGVLAAHSYFWATGQNGSIGLTRIATQGMPLFLLVQVYFVSKFSFLTPPRSRVFGVAACMLSFAVLKSPHFPVKAGPMEQQLIKAADFLKRETPHNRRVHYHYPLLVFAYGENPFKDGNRLRHAYFQDFYKRVDREILPGEFIVWDSHFGPVEAGLSLDSLKHYTQFVLVREYLFTQSDASQGGVKIYQYIPRNKQVTVAERQKTVHLEPFKVESDKEYLSILEKIPDPKKGVTIELEIRSETPGLKLVYDHNRGEQYSATGLQPGKKLRFTFELPSDGLTDIYLWNPEKKSGNVFIVSAELKAHVFHPVMR
ncbi:MAG: hypothetical protein RIT43_1853 [Bacteroidota bacterium]